MEKKENKIHQEQGDKFLEAINQNLGILHRICNSYFYDDPVEKEDLYQEIMYQLWKSYPSFQGGAKFSTWMYRVSLNTAITHKKKDKRSPSKVGLTGEFETLTDIKDPPLEKEEDIKLLYKAINTLSAMDKAIILLYLEENPYEEISSVTGLSKNNISVRLVRIKQALSKKLKVSSKTSATTCTKP